MVRPTLYYFGPSAPCRVALLTAKLLGLDVEVKEVNLFKKEQFNEDFLKINPQHTVPALVDDDYVLTESLAIAIYLIESNFPNGHSLYPKDAKNRGIINQRIFFDTTVLFPRIRGIVRPVLFSGMTKIPDKDRQDLFDAIDYVDKNYFKGNQFIAKTDQPTLADLSILASIATFVSIGGDLTKYPNIAAWYDLCKDLPGNAENLAGAKQLGDIVQKSLEEPL